MSFPPPQGPASSLPDPEIISRLWQVYVVLQSYDHAWSQANSFWSLVLGRSEAQLSELERNWTQWVDNIQLQLLAAAQMV